MRKKRKHNYLEMVGSYFETGKLFRNRCPDLCVGLAVVVHGVKGRVIVIIITMEALISLLVTNPGPPSIPRASQKAVDGISLKIF